METDHILIIEKEKLFSYYRDGAEWKPELLHGSAFVRWQLAHAEEDVRQMLDDIAAANGLDAEGAEQLTFQVVACGDPVCNGKIQKALGAHAVGMTSFDDAMGRVANALAKHKELHIQELGLSYDGDSYALQKGSLEKCPYSLVAYPVSAAMMLAAATNGEIAPTEEIAAGSDLMQLKQQRVAQNLRKMDLMEQVPDEMYEPLARKVERLRAIYALPELQERSGKLMDRMDAMLALCRRPEFQIAFVGTIKTGKSTLINALLGKNYASMDVTPETAALTKFRMSPKDYVEVTFYTTDEWAALWASRHHADKFMEEYEALDAESQRPKWVGHETYRREMTSDELEEELSRWSSSKHAEHYFVKEIEVGISTLPKDFPTSVVFVDTPGLNDPVSYRSELTTKYIRRANAVFVCVDAQKVQQAEIETIASVLSISSTMKEKVYIVATQWDRLNNPVDDWKKQKAWLERQLTGPGFFESVDVAASHIFHTAAFIQILCRDYKELTKKERIPLMKFALDMDFDASDKKDRKKMVELANVHAVGDIIRNELAENYRTYLMEDIRARYSDIHHELLRIAGDVRQDRQEFLEATKNSIEELHEQVAKKKADYEEIQNVSKQLQGILDQFETTTAQTMTAVCAKLRLAINPKYQKPPKKKQIDLLHSIARTLLGGSRRHRRHLK
ncbi:dynamin family protein [uncultured Selenomonas sp.]|uniref:dynamin family protein n=1 Tax=uncultured Selenomonas sp. TaxID=159275 RepID=UPI0025FCFD16|nr:dynamin family protein [uncultured Selenomonas sp.]